VDRMGRTLFPVQGERPGGPPVFQHFVRLQRARERETLLRQLDVLHRQLAEAGERAATAESALRTAVAEAEAQSMRAGLEIATVRERLIHTERERDAAQARADMADA